ncbi:MAG TPA: hypothetical protein VGC80_12600, partial [Acetobacteraceae bacterium]
YAVPTAGGAVVRLVDTATTVPGASKTFTSLTRNGFQHDGTTAVFTGSAAGVTGVYSVRIDGAGLARIADSNTPVNSAACDLFPVFTFTKPSISNGNIGFLGQTTFDYNAGFSALYTRPLAKAATPTCSGPTPSAVNSAEPLPTVAGTHIQTQLDYGRMDGARLVFRAGEAATGTGGIYSTGMDMAPGGAAITTIVDSTSALPGLGLVAFTGSFAFAVDSGGVVFQAHAGQNYALFLARSGVVTRIAGSGDGSILAVDAPSPNSLRGATAAFLGTATDGSRALYFARPTQVQPPAPTIGSVANAASNRGGAVSPGEIVVVYGAGMGPAAVTGSALDTNGRLSNQRGGTRILFDGVAAPLLYVSDTQAAAIVPYAVDGRAQTQLAVEYQNVTSTPVALAVAGSAPGLFSADTSGQGQGAILNEDGSYNSASTPAAAGSMVVLYATGEGQTSPGGIDGQMAAVTLPAPRLPVTVAVGGRNADILYAGAAPTEVAGLMQVNIRLPLGLGAGNLPIAISVGGTASQPGLTVAVR